MLSIGESVLPLSVESVLSKANKSGNFRSRFEAGVVDLDVGWLHQLLADNSDRKYSSVRHDIGFHTPSGQDRRFKVWISEDEDSRAIGSAVVKVGQGTLSTNFNSRLRADVAMPAHKFDCRLLIRTGQLHILHAWQPCEKRLLFLLSIFRRRGPLRAERGREGRRLHFSQNLL